MTTIKELLRRQQPNSDIVHWFGTVHSAPADLSDRMSVVVPDFDPGFVWTECRWMPRDAVSLPAKGDACVVVFDNRIQPWVLAWWPFT
jgi:hypothetical protein